MDYKERFPKLRGATMTVDPQGGIILDTEDEVERTGYRSANDQINELLRAGIRLQEARAEKYAEPTGLTSRLYGEIDRTVADDKIEIIRSNMIERIKAKRAEQDEARKRTSQPEPEETSKEPVQTRTEQGGVT